MLSGAVASMVSPVSVTFHVLTWVAAMAASSVNSPTAAQNGSMTCPNAMVSALAPPSRWLLHALSDSTLNAGEVSLVRHPAHFGGEQVAHVSLVDQLLQPGVYGGRAGLDADHRANALLPRQGGHLLGLGQVLAEGPLGVDVLARLQRRGRGADVARRLETDEHGVDLVAPDHLAVVVEGQRRAERLRRLAGRLHPGRARRRDLELRQRRYRLQVGVGPACDVRPDRAYPDLRQ